MKIRIPKVNYKPVKERIPFLEIEDKRICRNEDIIAGFEIISKELKDNITNIRDMRQYSTTYLDTKDMWFKEHNFTLRIREISKGKALFGMKSLKGNEKCGLLIRHEEEIEYDPAGELEDAFNSTISQDVIHNFNENCGKEVLPLFETIVGRSSIEVNIDGVDIDIVFDDIYYKNYETSELSKCKESEIELEYIGKTRLPFKKIEKSFNVVWGTLKELQLEKTLDSKAQRGYNFIIGV